MIRGESAFSRAGWSVSGAGDVDGDGLADVLVGARRAGPEGNRTGAAYVVFGRRATAAVELVDERGNVVQKTTSTASGSYRFRNVKSKKKYKVRVRKKGKKAKEMDLAPAAAAAEQKADFAL